MPAQVAEWDAILTAADVPHAPVRSVGAALEAAHSSERKMVMEVDHPTAGRIRNTGRAIKFSGHDSAAPLRAAPLLGADSVSVLEQLLKYYAAGYRAVAGGRRAVAMASERHSSRKAAWRIVALPIVGVATLRQIKRSRWSSKSLQFSTRR